MYVFVNIIYATCFHMRSVFYNLTTLSAIDRDMLATEPRFAKALLCAPAAAVKLASATEEPTETLLNIYENYKSNCAGRPDRRLSVGAVTLFVVEAARSSHDKCVSVIVPQVEKRFGNGELDDDGELALSLALSPENVRLLKLTAEQVLSLAGNLVVHSQRYSAPLTPDRVCTLLCATASVAGWEGASSVATSVVEKALKLKAEGPAVQFASALVRAKGVPATLSKKLFRVLCESLKKEDDSKWHPLYLRYDLASLLLEKADLFRAPVADVLMFISRLRTLDTSIVPMLKSAAQRVDGGWSTLEPHLAKVCETGEVQAMLSFVRELLPVHKPTARACAESFVFKGALLRDSGENSHGRLKTTPQGFQSALKLLADVASPKIQDGSFVAEVEKLHDDESLVQCAIMAAGESCGQEVFARALVCGKRISAIINMAKGKAEFVPTLCCTCSPCAEVNTFLASKLFSSGRTWTYNGSDNCNFSVSHVRWSIKLTGDLTTQMKGFDVDRQSLLDVTVNQSTSPHVLQVKKSKYYDDVIAEATSRFRSKCEGYVQRLRQAELLGESESGNAPTAPAAALENASTP